MNHKYRSYFVLTLISDHWSVYIFVASLCLCLKKPNFVSDITIAFYTTN